MPGVSPPDDSVEPIQDLSEVIKESQAVMNESPAVPVKNKGGRPKGSKTRNRTSQDDAPATAAPPVAPPAPSLAPLLGMVAAAPYAIAAARTRFEGFRLNEEEQTGIGQSLDAVVLKYFPNLSDKAGVGVMCCFTIVSVTLVKMQMYEAWKIEIMRAVREKQAETQTDLKPAESVNPVTDMSNNPFVTKL